MKDGGNRRWKIITATDTMLDMENKGSRGMIGLKPMQIVTLISKDKKKAGDADALRTNLIVNYMEMIIKQEKLMTNPRKREFRHDFFGSLDPKMEPQLHGYGACKTFSLGIFRWLPYASGKRKGLKKSTVMYRVKGYTSNPEPVYKRAIEICEELDIMYEKDPLWMGPYKKSETVR